MPAASPVPCSAEILASQRRDSRRVVRLSGQTPTLGPKRLSRQEGRAKQLRFDSPGHLTGSVQPPLISSLCNRGIRDLSEISYRLESIRRVKDFCFEWVHFRPHERQGFRYAWNLARSQLLVGQPVIKPLHSKSLVSCPSPSPSPKQQRRQPRRQPGGNRGLTSDRERKEDSGR